MTQHFSQTSADRAAIASVDVSSPALSTAASFSEVMGATGGNPLSAAPAAAPDMSLSSRAMAAMKVPDLSTARAVPCPPNGNTGGTLRHGTDAEPGEVGGNPPETPANAGVFSSETGTVGGQNLPPSSGTSGTDPQDGASNYPPTAGGDEADGKKKRKSRAQATTPEMSAFLDAWFFDWLTVTMPNSLDGTGRRRRAARDQRDMAEDRAGDIESRAAEDRLCRWAMSEGLLRQRIGHGSDGYRGAMHYGLSPVEGARLATIRTGHAANMPGLELPGGDGACAHLALSALDLLGPVNLARADVAFDWVQEGLFDALLAYARDESRRQNRDFPRLEDRGRGRTFYWGAGETSVKVYEKSMERWAKGKLIGPPDPARVRIEFSFAPHKVGDKAGLARLAAECGPGALLGTSLWVRRMVRHVATLTGAAGENAARLAVSRVDRLPVSKTCEDRARACLASSVKAFCDAAAARIVADAFGGDWLAADIEPTQIRAGVMSMVGTYLDATDEPARAASRLGLTHVREKDEEAARNADDLRGWLDWQERETAKAQQRLSAAYERASDGAGRHLSAMRADIRRQRDELLLEQETQRGLQECIATLSAHLRRFAMRRDARNSACRAA